MVDILKKNSTRPHQASLGDVTRSGSRSLGSPIKNSLHVEVGWRLNGPLMTVRHGEGCQHGQILRVFWFRWKIFFICNCKSGECTGLALMHILSKKLGLTEKGLMQDMHIFEFRCEFLKIYNCVWKFFLVLKSNVSTFPHNILMDCSK